jgi:hypothetical protein
MSYNAVCLPFFGRAEGGGLPGESTRRRIRHIRPDGTPHPSEGIWSRGEVTFVNITERKRAWDGTGDRRGRRCHGNGSITSDHDMIIPEIRLCFRRIFSRMAARLANGQRTDKTNRARGTALPVAAWGIVVGGGFLFLGSYAARPGAAGHPAARWPGESRVRPEAARPNLVLLLHPHCPCSRASLRELERIMARCRDRLSAHVLVFRPAKAPRAWNRSGFWHAAAAIPGVRVYDDDGGAEAARFGVATSGHVLLFDPSGRLVFRGGITRARGHEGDNSGRDAVVALVGGERADAVTTPVFGCSLLDPGSQFAGEAKTWSR